MREHEKRDKSVFGGFEVGLIETDTFSLFDTLL